MSVGAGGGGACALGGWQGWGGASRGAAGCCLRATLSASTRTLTLTLALALALLPRHNAHNTTQNWRNGVNPLTGHIGRCKSTNSADCHGNCNIRTGVCPTASCIANALGDENLNCPRSNNVSGGRDGAAGGRRRERQGAAVDRGGEDRLVL